MALKAAFQSANLNFNLWKKKLLTSSSGYEVTGWHKAQDTDPWQYYFSKHWEGGLRARTCSIAFNLHSKYKDDDNALSEAPATYTVLEAP